MNSAPSLLLLLTLSATAQNWPQWRGPDSAAVSTQPNLPSTWSATSNIPWNTPIPGRGHSSPVVWGKRIFLTTSLEGAPKANATTPAHSLRGKPFVHPDSVDAERTYTLQLLSLDQDTGKILWQSTAFEGRVYDARHKKNTYASPTPVTDGKRVYVSFESQGVYAFDFNGKLLWKAFPGNIKTEGLGPGTSPVLFNDILILQCDQDEGDQSFLIAWSASTGELLWKTPRKNHVTWSTPILVNSQLISAGSEATIAYDPRTGKELWRGPGVEGNSVPSTVAGHGMIFVTCGYPMKRIVAIDATTNPGKAVWQFDKGPGYVPSPILYGDHLYVMSDRGLLTALEARTGKVIYEGKRPPVPATFSASPVAFDGKLFTTSEDGETYVVQAGPDHQILHTNSIGEPVHASIAIANGGLLLRSNSHLYSIRKPIAVIAHRGAHQQFKENTLDAYREAIRLGCDYIEVDVRTTSDGVLVIKHDKLREPEPHLPTFEEVLSLAKGKIGVYVDVKQAAAPALVNAITKAGMTDQVVVYGSVPLLTEIAMLSPQMKVMPEAVSILVLTTNLAALKLRVVAFSDWNWKDDIIAPARTVGADIYIDRLGKADNPDSWQDALHRGATGIQTDKPAELLSFLRARHLHP